MDEGYGEEVQLNDDQFHYIILLLFSYWSMIVADRIMIIICYFFRLAFPGVDLRSKVEEW